MDASAPPRFSNLWVLVPMLFRCIFLLYPSKVENWVKNNSCNQKHHHKHPYFQINNWALVKSHQMNLKLWSDTFWILISKNLEQKWKELLQKWKMIRDIHFSQILLCKYHKIKIHFLIQILLAYNLDIPQH